MDGDDVLSGGGYRSVERTTYAVPSGRREAGIGRNLSLPERNDGEERAQGMGCRAAVCGDFKRHEAVRQTGENPAQHGD